MTFETTGDPAHPAVLLIHGMLCTGADCRPFGECLADTYYVIMPTLDGHGKDGTDLLTVEEEAEKIVSYLKKNAVRELKLLQGSSMGAEVALAVRAVLEREKIPVDCCFFDGGPFFDFTPAFRRFMYTAFSKLVKIFDTDDPEQAADNLMHDPFVKFVARDKIEQYQPLIRSMAEERRTFSDKTISNMVRICYACQLPDFPEQVQSSFVFFFSKEEPARKSRKRLLKAFPKAKYRDMNGYAHCGFQTQKPEAYARMLRMAIAGVL